MTILVLPITGEIEDLALEYLKAGVVTTKFEDDARHVAVCTVHRVDHLVSWNFNPSSAVDQAGKRFLVRREAPKPSGVEDSGQLRTHPG